MEELIRKVKAAIPAVNWFALGEAKKIVRDVNAALVAYQRESDTKNANAVKAVADRAAAFLLARSTEESNEHGSSLKDALRKL